MREIEAWDQKKTEKEQNNDNWNYRQNWNEKKRKQVQISVKSVWKGCQNKKKLWRKQYSPPLQRGQ